MPGTYKLEEAEVDTPSPVSSKSIYKLSDAQPDEDVTVTDTETPKGGLAGFKEAMTTPSNWVPAAGAVAARTIGAVPSMVAGFVDSNNRHLAEDPAQAEANIRSLHNKGKEAIDAFHKGEYGQAAKHASEAIGQYFGLDDQVKAINDHLSSGDERGAAGYGLGLLTQLGAGAGLNHVLGWADGSVVGNKLWGALNKVEPRIPILQAYGANAVDLKTIDTAIQDIKTGAAGKPIKTNADAIAAAKTYLKMNRKTFEAYQASKQGPDAKVSGEDIGKAMLDAAGDTLQQEHPEAYEAIERKAKTWNRDFTEAELGKRLSESNAKLNGFYNAGTAKQNAMINSGLNVAEEEAKVRALRETYYKFLHPEGEGAGPRELQKRYGGVLHFLSNAVDAEGSIQSQLPDSLMQGLKQDMGHDLTALRNAAIGHTHMPRIGVTVPKNANELIARAFEHADTGGPHPLPPNSPPINRLKELPPASSMVGVSGVIAPDLAGKIQTDLKTMQAGPRQLEAAPQPSVPTSGKTILTPPPEDPSFAVGVPAVAVTPTTRLLEAGKPPIVTPPPQDKSYAVGVPGVGSTRSTNQLPPATTRITEPPETSFVTALDAAKGIQRGKNGKFFKVYSSGAKVELTPQQLMDLRRRPVTIQDLMGPQKDRE